MHAPPVRLPSPLSVDLCRRPVDAATVKQWRQAWSRLIAAREKLQSFGPDYAIVRHILVLDDTRPGNTISLDESLVEAAPPVEVLKALENFNKALRREDSAFRQPRTADMAAVEARWKFAK
jgi:hypothetical protein